MPAIGAKQFLEPRELKRRNVPLSNWGHGEDDYLVMLALSARSLLDLQAKHGDKANVEKIEVMADFLGASLIDEDGKLLFASDQAREAILGKGLPFLRFLFDQLMDLSGIPLEDDGSGETELPNSQEPSCSSAA